MKTVIVNSLSDPAGTNIHDRLVEDFNFIQTSKEYDGLPVYERESCILITSKKEIFLVDGLDEYFPGSEFIFISRHRAESGIPSLTAHFPGNFGPNEFGGHHSQLANFSPSALKAYFMSLNSLKDEIPPIYKLTLEATHHGPTSLCGPAMFVELGSTPEQWRDEAAARCIANALVKSMLARVQSSKCAVAFGGTHYPDKFNRFLLESEYALGPIVPKYDLSTLDRNMMEQLVAKGDQKITHAVLDMKGLSSHKEKVVKFVNEFSLEMIRV